MSERERFSPAARVASFRPALRGVGDTIRTQHNAWIHGGVTTAVCAIGFWVGLGPRDWALIVLAIAGVWVAEFLNTALEHLCDVASPEFHPLVARAKDAAAGAVLIAAGLAAAVGLLILGPPVLARIG
jgi:diacylglycerol kinase (ATP)